MEEQIIELQQRVSNLERALASLLITVCGEHIEESAPVALALNTGAPIAFTFQPVPDIGLQITVVPK